jgi:tetratricopeptide (TPR) repeat protein
MHISSVVLVVALALLEATTIQGSQQGQDAQAHFRRGKDLFEVHDDSGEALREAEVEFRQALQLDPRMAAALAYLGFIAADQDKPQQAEAAYRKALELDGNSPEARVGLAQLSIRNRRNQEAIALLREAVAHGPENQLALRELAAVLSGENFHPTPEMWREAIRCWETLIKLDPEDRQAHLNLAGGYRRFGRWQDAEREYREVLRIGQIPEDMDVWVYSVHRDVAEMLEKQGRFSQAIDEYRALIGSDGAGEQQIADAKARIRTLEKLVRAK